MERKLRKQAKRQAARRAMLDGTPANRQDPRRRPDAAGAHHRAQGRAPAAARPGGTVACGWCGATSPCPTAAGSPSGAPPPAVTARGSNVGQQPQDAQPSRSSIDRWRSFGRSRRCRGSSSRRPSLSHRRRWMNGPAFSRSSPTGSTAAASTTGTFRPSGQPSLLWSKPSTVAGPDASPTRPSTFHQTCFQGPRTVAADRWPIRGVETWRVTTCVQVLSSERRPSGRTVSLGDGSFPVTDLVIYWSAARPNAR
jgi:hypothetical protein